MKCDATRNNDRTKTIAKAEDFIKSKDLQRRKIEQEQRLLRKTRTSWKCKLRTSIINVFACIRISN